MVDSEGDVTPTGLKTINNESIIGGGNIVISAGGTIAIDDQLSPTSTNPVQNKVIKAAFDSVDSYIPSGSITRDKLSFLTRPLRALDANQQVWVEGLAEFYFVPEFVLPNDQFSIKYYGSKIYIRPVNMLFQTQVTISSYVNDTIYECRITSTTDAENYPVGTLVGYYMFDDIDSFRSYTSGSTPNNVNISFCRSLSSNPSISSYLQRGNLPNSAVTVNKIGWSSFKPLSALESYDVSEYVSEFYLNPDIPLPVSDLCLKSYGALCYYRPSDMAFRATCTPTANNRVYELTITQTTDETLYPLGATAAYVIFSDVESFMSHGNSATPLNVNTDYCKVLANHPYIFSYLTKPDAPLDIATYNEDRNVEICLPSTLYAVVGDNIQLFHKSILRCYNPYIYSISVVCNIGNNYPRYYEVTPTASQVGNHNLTYIVRDQNAKVISQKTVTLKVVNEGVSPANNMNVLCIGASATAAGNWPSELKRRLTSTTGTPVGAGLSNITFVGRMSATPSATEQQVNFEATGGYTFGSYVRTDDYLCKFYFETEHLPNYVLPGDVYSYAGVEYTITEINIPSTDAGYAGYISGRPNGNGTSGTHGVLTKVSGTGDDTITFDDSSRSGNPFCYDGVVNLQRYANEFCNGTIDLVYSQLVFNGATINGTVEQIKASSNIANMITFANYLHTAFPNAKLGLGTGYNPDGKGGCGASYGASNSTEYGYKFYVMNLAKAFEEAIEENNLGDFVFIATNTPEIDSENSFPSTTKPVNNRSTVTEVVGTNGVHPTFVGQAQLADSYYRDFIARFCQSE